MRSRHPSATNTSNGSLTTHIAFALMGCGAACTGAAFSLTTSLGRMTDLLQFGIPIGAVGAALATQGTMSPRRLVSTIGNATRKSHIAFAAAAGAGGLIAMWLFDRTITRRDAAHALTVAAVAVFSLFLLRRIIGTRPSGVASRSFKHSATSAAISGVVALMLVTGIGGLEELFPFSKYPMYAGVKEDPWTVQTVTFEGTRGNGEVLTMQSELSRNTLGIYARNRDEEGFRSAADAIRKRRPNIRFTSIEVHVDTEVIPPYPDAPAVVELPVEVMFVFEY